MDDILHMIALWGHILGIALFVGPQFFLAFAAIPASRHIADLNTRIEALRTMTTRFGYVGGAGLVLILIAGTYLISTWRDYYGIGDETSFVDLRYGVIFIAKMVVLIVMLALVGLHTFVIGPMQIEAMEGEARGDGAAAARLPRLRTVSITVSVVALFLTLVIMLMGASMTTSSYSLEDF